MKKTTIIRLMICLVVGLGSGTAWAASKVKYPGPKQYIWRYTLRDKQGSAYTLEHPGRWLSHKSIERRRRQGLGLDSTDLPVSAKYLREMEKTAAGVAKGEKKKAAEWQTIGTSRWQNTVLVRSTDTLLLRCLARLDFVSEARQVWQSPDSIERRGVKIKVHEGWNAWDSIRGDIYGNSREQIEMLSGQRLHDIGHRGRGMTIAVIDGGFQNCNEIPAMQRANIVGVYDFVPDHPGHPEYPGSTSHPASPGNVFRETDHGTKVLSTMAANEPQVFVGTAPDARYWLLRSEDQQTEQPVEEDYWTMAAEFADSVGVDIISSSLGYSNYDGTDNDYHQRDLDGHTALISRSASLLAKKGIILVSSAGNSGMGPWKKIEVPGDAHDILTVGALNRQKENAPFSGVGPTQDGRVKPDVMALGSPACMISGRGTIVRDMGTSFSTPIVAGLVACLWQALPEKTALEIIKLVRQTASQHDQPDNIYGYGTPNFWRAYMIGKKE
ncbi:MAG: S8 family serine peptidase [Prevotella sp.]|nr:S8 family serine peptidase [Prevotella sp.]